MIEITPAAQEYLADLLSKQNQPGIAIRVFVAQPGTPQAETCIAYCRPGEEQEGDIAHDYGTIQAWFEGRSQRYLEDALVDYREDRLGGQLTIKAPNARTPRVDADSPIEDRINYVLYNDINPSLASHGGMVSLVEIDAEDYAILSFGGGCQGCSAVDITLKQGVEKTLLEHVPELAGVRDATDHTVTENAYYR